MQASLRDPRAVDSNVKTILMSCLKGQQVIIKMEAMKIIHPEKFSELQASQPRYAPAPRREPPLVAKRAWPSESEIIVNQACGDIPALDATPGPLPLPRTPPLPRRERGYQSQRKGSSEVCYHRQPPSDEGIVKQYALMPADALPPNPVQWSSDTDRSCYQTFRQYCGAACTCHIRNPLSSCTIM
ncbi:PREDICTED: RING finger protein 208 [Charadrius vociferus]|uniref:RING finger protein 208 n=1 Tax=Charadrius vociferus TaxID=50402 RepID=UPI0005215536|nr:PREDICTED: RING finger protein 208 [Charadrius vociferus]